MNLFAISNRMMTRDLETGHLKNCHHLTRKSYEIVQSFRYSLSAKHNAPRWSELVDRSASRRPSVRRRPDSGQRHRAASRPRSPIFRSGVNQQAPPGLQLAVGTVPSKNDVSGRRRRRSDSIIRKEGVWSDSRDIRIVPRTVRTDKYRNERKRANRKPKRTIERRRPVGSHKHRTAESHSFRDKSRCV